MPQSVPSAETLIECRERRYLTRLQAAVGIGVSPQTLARAENGLDVRPASMKRIADFYGLTLAEEAETEAKAG